MAHGQGSTALDLDRNLLAIGISRTPNHSWKSILQRYHLYGNHKFLVTKDMRLEESLGLSCILALPSSVVRRRGSTGDGWMDCDTRYSLAHRTNGISATAIEYGRWAGGALLG